MVQELPDTTSQAIIYCPGCQPDRDPIAEILDTRWCEVHNPPRGGPDDEKTGVAARLTVAEAWGDNNRRWCEIVHGH